MASQPQNIGAAGGAAAAQNKVSPAPVAPAQGNAPAPQQTTAAATPRDNRDYNSGVCVI